MYMILRNVVGLKLEKQEMVDSYRMKQLLIGLDWL